ncbi:MAG: ATP-binding protein [Candidatus Korobacteraceae bacterium]|jgi:signal transduction histidine kinase
MINIIGQSHPGSVVVTNLVLSALHSDPRFQVEFYWENLDAIYHPDELQEQLDAVVQQYRHRKLDLIVLLGPNAIQILAEPRTIFPNVPAVFCCSAPGQIDQTRIDRRSTGSWFQLEPSKTVEAALGLLPETRHLFAVGGQSAYDRRLTSLAKTALTSYENKLDVTYLTDLPMSELQERLRHLPEHSIVLYLSFFKDVQGREFLNIAEALPLIAGAANAPVFGIADTQLGHGVVGGFVVSFEEQGKIVGRDALEILAGKPPQDIPIVHGPSLYQFDWRELQRWKLDESRLPAGSTILFRQPTIWERYGGTLLIGLLVLVTLSLLIFYLLFERTQLDAARNEQIRLSGRLINAQEDERARLASELHDDFSQRLAVLSLGLETAAEIVPESPAEANRQLHELINSAGELGADLHTLSHRLHSSTLERLGLAAGVAAFCKEFAAQRGIQVAFSHENVPRSVSPDISLCLFRIVQEGLRNVQKHSGAARAQVRIDTMDGTLHLSISDDGEGFDVDVKDGVERQGLGLWSMRERVRLVGGRFEIHSETQKGTRIEVWVPLKKRFDMARSEPADESVGRTPIASRTAPIDPIRIPLSRPKVEG